MFSFETSSGSLASWLEERSGVCRGGWAIGCRACRLAGFRDLWGRTRISGGTVGAWPLKRHDTSASHQRALAIVRQMGEDDPAEIAKLAVTEDREDVPSYALCFAAYKGALKGNAFTEYTEDVGFAATLGASVPKSRRSRNVARQLVECFGAELSSEDQALLRESTHIHLSSDGRKSNFVFRVRMTLKSMPEGYCREGGQTPAGGQAPVAEGKSELEAVEEYQRYKLSEGGSLVVVPSC